MIITILAVSIFGIVYSIELSKINKNLSAKIDEKTDILTRVQISFREEFMDKINQITNEKMPITGGIFTGDVKFLNDVTVGNDNVQIRPNGDIYTSFLRLRADLDNKGEVIHVENAGATIPYFSFTQGSSSSYNTYLDSSTLPVSKP